jgi:hypothetical protein
MDRASLSRWLCRLGQHARKIVVLLLLAMIVLVSPNSLVAYGYGISHLTFQAPKPQGVKHRIDPKSGAKSILHRPPQSQLPSFAPLSQRPIMSHGFVPTMKRGSLKLDPD